MRTNVVLIDYESVQPPSLRALEQEHYRVLVFVGATQSKVPFELAAALQRFGERAEYIKISGTGPNALDFHIAFYIGQIAAKDPTTFFHVISKDTGFDPLIRHLKSAHIFAARSVSIEEMPLIKVSAKKSSDQLAKAFAESLRQPKATKPRTDKTLARHIAAFFGIHQLSEKEVTGVVQAMQAAGFIELADGRVSYSLA